MLDVQYPTSSFSHQLFSAGSSTSQFPSSAHYWSEQHSSKRRNISQETHTSIHTRSQKSSSSSIVPSVRRTSKSSVESAVPATSTDTMNGSGYSSQLTQHQSYSSAPAVVDARTYYATPTTLPQSSPSPLSTSDLQLNEARAAMLPEEPEFLPAEDLRAANGSNIASYLQLPHSISNAGGSLAQFAAETTCIFWFESLSTLQAIEQYRDDAPLPVEQMSFEAYPQTGFLKWVTTILSTTQVTQNVILMALSFIHRLKRLNPTVRGKIGSEFRLLTVALMLGNKFLDDNTYTNKTWAEVSGISVHEIHVMEMEFLSHLKYNLYMSKEEWLQWHKTLASYYNFLEGLAKTRNESALAASSSRRPSVMPYHLPSPPISLTASPAYADAIAPQGGAHTNRPVFNSSFTPDSAGQSANEHGYIRERKRSYQIDDQEPPAKRQSTYGIYPSVMVSGQYGQPGPAAPNGTLPSLPTLPTPNLSAHPAQQQLYSMPYHYVSSQKDTMGSSRMLSSHQLPPLQSWPQMSGTETEAPSVQHQHQRQQSQQQHQQPYQQAQLHQLQLGTPMDPLSRHHTPVSSRSGHAPTLSSQIAHTMMPDQLSPSYFLHRRSSPYRPVRNMNTLLNPPPSASMSRIQHNIPQEQMRWQPLGKNVEERTGRIPTYYARDGWETQSQYYPPPPSSAEFSFIPN